MRAAARAVKLAIMAPVTKPTEAVTGRPSNSMSHRPVISSTTAAAGAQEGQAGVLVPRRGEPVRRDARRCGAADHEAEEAAALGGHESRFGSSDQGLDHLGGIDSFLRQARRPGWSADRTGGAGASRTPGRPWRKSIAAREAASGGLSQSGVSTSALFPSEVIVGCELCLRPSENAAMSRSRIRPIVRARADRPYG